MRSRNLAVLVATAAASLSLAAAPASAAPAGGAGAGAAAGATTAAATTAASRVVRKVWQATSRDAGVAADRVLRLKRAFERDRKATCASPYEHTVTNPRVSSSDGGRTWKAVGTYDCTLKATAPAPPPESPDARGCDDARLAPVHQRSRNGVTLRFSDALGASVRYCWNPDGVWVTNFTAIGRRATFFLPSGRSYERQDPGGDRAGADYRWAQRMTPTTGFLDSRDARVYGFGLSYIDVDVQLRVAIVSVNTVTKAVCVNALVRHEGRTVGSVKRSGAC